jgi:hypothetical protein
MPFNSRHNDPPLDNAARRTVVSAGQAGLKRRRVLLIAAVAGLAVIVVVVGALWRAGQAGGPAAALDPMVGPDPGVAHVYGLGVDPADGTLYAATRFGLFTVPEQGKATRIANRYQDTMGFTVVGPKHFLGSGHPDQRENLPGRLGLIESTDGGQSWRELSLEGTADFHALEFRHGQVYGYESSTGQLMVSSDRISWDRRATVPIADFVVSPASADVLLATTRQGLTRSGDGGRTFAAVRGAPLLTVLAWPTEQVVYGVAADGTLQASSDGGIAWRPRGKLDGRPQAMTAADDARVYVATETGIYASTDGGRTFTPRYRDG